MIINLIKYINGLVQDCSISSALAVEILQSCTKPLIYSMISETDRQIFGTNEADIYLYTKYHILIFYAEISV